jgi:hypothetical protein
MILYHQADTAVARAWANITGSRSRLKACANERQDEHNNR